MKTRWPRIPAFIALLALNLATSSIASAASPRGLEATHPLGHLSLEGDTLIGVAMLRPSTWSSAPIQAGRVWKSSGIAVSIQDLSQAAQSRGADGLVLTERLFRAHPSLDGWASALQVLWSNYGIDYHQLRSNGRFRIYVVSEAPGAERLVAPLVLNGRPYAVELESAGTGALPGGSTGQALVNDFATIVASAAVRVANSSVTTSATAPQIQPYDLGPYSGDSGYRYYGSFTYRLEDSYYEAPPRIYWLYEYMYYSQYEYHTEYLYRTSVTYYPQQACVYGGSWDVYRHPIGKAISSTTGVASDSYYPNVIENQISGAQHMMVFGDPLVVICEWYAPFTR